VKSKGNEPPPAPKPKPPHIRRRPRR
jgi:hypothetical protein